MKERRPKAPAFQWYPGDHNRDTAIATCSFEAEALWRKMLDLMHDGSPRGHLSTGERRIDVPELARIAKISDSRTRKYLEELEVRGVFSRTETGVIYSRRMVHDEAISAERRRAGKLGGNPALVSSSHHPTDKYEDKQIEPVAYPNVKQNPTPAVADCGLRSADLQFADALTAEQRNGAAAAPPIAATAETADLPPDAQRFLDRFSANRERRGDIEQQMRESLTARGVKLRRGEWVHAGSPERLAEKCREVMAAPPKKLDSAIVVLLKKLGDTSDGSAPGAREAAQLRVEERDDEAELRAARAWGAAHPDVVARLEADAAPVPDGAFGRMVRQSQIDQGLLDEWRGANRRGAAAASAAAGSGRVG